MKISTASSQGLFLSTPSWIKHSPTINKMKGKGEKGKPWGAPPGRGAGRTSAQVKESQAMQQELWVPPGSWRRRSLPGCCSQRRHVVQNSQACKCRLETILLPVCPTHQGKCSATGKHLQTTTRYKTKEKWIYLPVYLLAFHCKQELRLLKGFLHQERKQLWLWAHTEREVLLRKKCYF